MLMQGIAYHHLAARRIRDHESALTPNIFGDLPVDRHADGAERASIFSTDRAKRAHGRLLAKIRQIDGQDAVVTRLAACATTRPCWHAVCPMCERLIGRWLAWTAPVAMRRVLKSRVNILDKDWSSFCRPVTIAAARLGAREFNASREIYPRIVNRLHDALRQAGITVAIGGIEFAAIRDTANYEELEFVLKLRAITFYGESELFGPTPIKSRIGPGRSALKEAMGKTV